jgi:hypothetical protein
MPLLRTNGLLDLPSLAFKPLQVFLHIDQVLLQLITIHIILCQLQTVIYYVQYRLLVQTLSLYQSSINLHPVQNNTYIMLGLDEYLLPDLVLHVFAADLMLDLLLLLDLLLQLEEVNLETVFLEFNALDQGLLHLLNRVVLHLVMVQFLRLLGRRLVRSLVCGENQLLLPLEALLVQFVPVLNVFLLRTQGLVGMVQVGNELVRSQRV